VNVVEILIGLGVKNIKKNKNILYLIVIKEVWDRIISGEKTTEYRLATEYWEKRILHRDYDYMRITNGYGNDTRPYRLYKYRGATRVMKDSYMHYSIPLRDDDIIEERKKVGRL